MARKGVQAVVTMTALLGVAASAHAAGRFNLPTDLPQCLGYGYGAGYHAPILLGSPWAARSLGHERVQRRFLAPSGVAFGVPSTFVAPAAPVLTQPMHGAVHGTVQGPVHRPVIIAPDHAPGYGPQQALR